MNYVSQLCEDLMNHINKKHDLITMVCERPGNCTLIQNQESLNTHHSTIHELKTWVCRRGCHFRYIEKSEACDNLSTHLPGLSDLETRVLDHEYRWYDLRHRSLAPPTTCQLQICFRSHQELRPSAYDVAFSEVSGRQPSFPFLLFSHQPLAIKFLRSLLVAYFVWKKWIELSSSSFYTCFFRNFNWDSIVFIS